MKIKPSNLEKICAIKIKVMKEKVITDEQYRCYICKGDIVSCKEYIEYEPNKKIKEEYK